MQDAIDAFHQIGMPTWLILGVFVVYAISKELHLLSWIGPPGRMSEREALSADEIAFRKAILARLDSSEVDRLQLHIQLRACEDRHSDMEAKLDACERKHDTALNRISVLERLIQSAGIAQMPATIEELLAGIPETDKRKSQR